MKGVPEGWGTAPSSASCGQGRWPAILSMPGPCPCVNPGSDVHGCQPLAPCPCAFWALRCLTDNIKQMPTLCLSPQHLTRLGISGAARRVPASGAPAVHVSACKSPFLMCLVESCVSGGALGQTSSWLGHTVCWTRACSPGCPLHPTVQSACAGARPQCASSITTESPGPVWGPRGAGGRLPLDNCGRTEPSDCLI